MMDLTILVTTVSVLLTTAVLLLALNHFYRKTMQKRARLHFRFLKSLLSFVIILIAVYIILSLFSFTKEISKTLLRSGTLIVAVATFAAQKALGNVISGFSISASRPCEVGQKIKLMQGGTIVAEGYVRDMTMRHVVIEQYDGQTCVVPNSVVDACVIINTNYVSEVGNHLEIEVGYDTDVELARSLIREICESEPLLLHAEKLNITVSRITANGMVLKFTVWADSLNDSFQLCSNIRQRMIAEFRRAGISIPYQTISLDRETPISNQTEEGQ